jgi:peptidoglycan/LPS O-acetylase OafA/YrhL
MKNNINKENNWNQNKSETKEKLDGKLTGADGLRCIACLAVITHHLSQKLMVTREPHDLHYFALMGNIGVSIFFILSGFLLSYPFWKSYLNRGDFPDIKEYILRRATRIIPGFYIVLLVSTLLVIALKIPTEHLWTRFFAALTFTSGFHYITLFPSDIDGALWSISFEIFCYILMPIFMYGLFKLFGRKRSFLKSFSYWMGVMVLVLVVNQFVRILFTPDDINRGWQYGIIGGAKAWVPNYNPIGFFGHFSFGIIAAGVTTVLHLNSEKVLKYKKENVFDIITLITFACSIVFIWLMKKQPEFSFSFQKQPYFFPFYQLMIAAMLALFPHTNLVGRIFDNVFFKFTAKVSFGLYLWHQIIIFIVTTVWVFDFKNFRTWLSVSIGIVIAAYVVATLSYKFVEKPILDWSHKKTFKSASTITSIRG